MPIDQHQRGRLAVCSWSLQPTSPSHLVAMLEQCDLHAVSLALSPVINQPELWKDAAHVLTSAGVNIVSGMMATLGEDYSTLESIARTGGVRPDETWPANVAHAQAVAELASDIGLSLVTFHAGFLPEDSADPLRGRIMHRIAQVADIFAAKNINIALETGQEHARNLLHVLEELDRPNVGVNFDPANMILYRMGDPIDAMQQLGSHIVQVHIKDAVVSAAPGQWGTEVPVGQGQVNWPAFFQQVQRIDRRIDLVIEREAGDQRVADIRTAAQVVEQLAASESR